MPRGRPKGSKNKVPTEIRAIFQQLLEKKLPDLEAMIEETRFGIEIEKTMPDGQTVVGRLNADPGKAVDLLMKAAEFCAPKLQRMEVTLQQLPTEAILAELRRRASLNGSFKEGIPEQPSTH